MVTLIVKSTFQMLPDWALDLLDAFAKLQNLSEDPTTIALMEQALPKRVRGPRQVKASA